MDATMCEVEWAEQTIATAETVRMTFARVGVQPRRSACCPNCGSIIYTRRHPRCGVCAEELPAECRFDAAQAENVHSLLEEERRRHRAWLHRFNFSN